MSFKIKPRDYVFSNLETGRPPDCPWPRGIRNMDNEEYFKKYNLMEIRYNDQIWKYVRMTIEEMVTATKEKITTIKNNNIIPALYILYGQYDISAEDYAEYISKSEGWSNNRNNAIIIDIGRDSNEFARIYNKIAGAAAFTLAPECHKIKPILTLHDDEDKISVLWRKHINEYLAANKSIEDVSAAEYLLLMDSFESNRQNEFHLKKVEHTFRDLLSRFAHLYQAIIWELCILEKVPIIYHYSGRYIQTFACVWRFMQENAAEWPIKIYYSLVSEEILFSKICRDLYDGMPGSFYVRRGVGEKKMKYYGEAQKTMLLILQFYKKLELNIFVEQQSMLTSAATNNKDTLFFREGKNKKITAILMRSKIAISSGGETSCILYELERSKLTVGPKFAPFLEALCSAVRCYSELGANSKLLTDQLAEEAADIKKIIQERYKNTAKGPIIGRPKVDIIIGMTSSGKSRFARSLAKNAIAAENIFSIDHDDTLNLFPTYKNSFEECKKLHEETYKNVKFLLDNKSEAVASNIIRDEIDIKNYCRLYKCRNIKFNCGIFIYKIREEIRREISNLSAKDIPRHIIELISLHEFKSVKDIIDLYGPQYDYNITFILAKSDILVKNNIERGRIESRFSHYNVFVDSAVNIKNIFDELNNSEEYKNYFKNINYLENIMETEYKNIDAAKAEKIVNENQRLIGVAIGGMNSKFNKPPGMTFRPGLTNFTLNFGNLFMARKNIIGLILAFILIVIFVIIIVIVKFSGNDNMPYSGSSIVNIV